MSRWISASASAMIGTATKSDGIQMSTYLISFTTLAMRRCSRPAAFDPNSLLVPGVRGASSASSTSPLMEVTMWLVNDGSSSWLAQPDVTAICATPEPSPDPTATPAPSETFAPTEQRLFVETDLGLRQAVENAESDRNIVLTDDVALTETLVFPRGRTGLALRGGKGLRGVKGVGSEGCRA